MFENYLLIIIFKYCFFLANENFVKIVNEELKGKVKYLS